MNTVQKIKARGFNSKKVEVVSIKETGTATIKRKKKGVVPTVENCPLGQVNDKVWFRENLKMAKSPNNIHAEITAVSVEEINGSPSWVIEVKAI